MVKERRSDPYAQVVTFCKRIAEKLFEPEERRLAQMIDRIVNQNDSIRYEANLPVVEGFMFHSKPFDISKPTSYWSVEYPQLDPSLEPQMVAYLEEHKTLVQDQELIRQAMLKFLAGFTGDQNIRDRLPDCVVPLVPSLANLSRSEPWEQATGLSEQTIKRSQKVLSKIEFYATTRLIY